MKKKISIIQTMRHVVQLIFFLLLPGLYISTFSGIKQIYLALIGQGAGLTQLLPQIVEVVSIIPITILLGRFFCGWMCSFGALGDLIYSISSKLFNINCKVNKTTDKYLKLFKYALLIFLIAFIWTMDITVFAAFNPWDVFGNLATITQVPNFTYIASNFMPGLIIFVLIILGSVFIERFFCRYMCPLGAVFAITSKLRTAKIKKPKAKCESCRICTNNCAMGIQLYKGDEVRNGECIQCMKCISACPRKNVSLAISDKDVRPIIAGAAAVSVMTGFYYAGNMGVNASGITSGTTVTSSVNTTSSSSALYLDGTYKGTGTGFRGATTSVSVTVKNGKITDVTTLSTGDDMPYYNRAFSTVSSEIIDTQSPSVDSVSGATFSSRGIMTAVQDALSNATVTNGSSSSSTSSSDQSKTEESTASVSNNTAVQSTTASNNTASKSTTSASSTATTQSSTTATTKSGYTDGTYTGSGTGFRGATTTVSVTVKNGKITDVTTISTGDDRPYYNRAFSTVSSEIKSSQSTSVDTVSGATFSSKGIMAAVQDALS